MLKSTVTLEDAMALAAPRSPQLLTDCKLMGIRSLAAFLHLQFRWVYTDRS